jgi:MFS family permease
MSSILPAAPPGPPDAPDAPDGRDAPDAARLAVLVLAVVVLLNFIGRGMADSFTAFVLPLEEHFGWRRSDLTGVFASYMLVNGLFAPFAGLAFDRFGPRLVYCSGLLVLGLGAILASRAESLWHLYLSTGLLVGIGAAATGQTCATALIARWYRARLSTAIALVSAGAGAGMLVMVPLAQSLIETVGWRSSWQSLGWLMLVLVPVCMALPWARLARPACPVPGQARADIGPLSSTASANPSGTARGAASGAVHPERSGPEVPSDPVSETRSQPGASVAPTGPGVADALRSPAFWRLVQTFFFTAFATYLVTPQVVAYLIETGLPPLVAASAYGFAGLLSTAGVVAAGWLSDRFGIRRVALVSLALSSTGIFGLMLASWFPGLAAVALFVACFGIAQGARGPIVLTLSNRIFAGPRVAAITGMVYTSLAFGASLGAWLGGLIRDLSDGYRLVFLLSMLLFAVVAEAYRPGSVLIRSAAASRR